MIKPSNHGGYDTLPYESRTEEVQMIELPQASKKISKGKVDISLANSSFNMLVPGVESYPNEEEF